MTGTRRRWVLGLLVVASGALPAVLFPSARSAHAQAPDVAAWWSQANAGDPAPVPPTPPDVAEGDLLVQGSNAGPAAPPLGTAPSTAQAVAGLSFGLQPTDAVGALTLAVEGSPPPQISVVACRATSSFTDTSNGPWSQVPSYDATGCVTGKLEGGDVVFDGVSDLVANAALSVVLLPGPLDRVVFKQPSDRTLAVRHGGSIGPAAPPLGSGAGPGAAAPPSTSGSGAPVSPVAPGSLPGVTSTTTTNGGAAAPLVAGSSPATSAASPGSMRPVAASGGLGTDARRAVALAIIALEVLGFVFLVRSPDPGAAVLAAGAVGTGRLRPPDRWTMRGSEAEAVAGVGRFRRPRRGTAPQL